ncbi:uncharacterized protein V1510DRAFT_414048 [Dipodascopsis tothii]|uniref:uncharacterized protein n=1 Tax=Dipodascopsis tothii TaxID=44089 RepID=UPI0034CE98D0
MESKRSFLHLTRPSGSSPYAATSASPLNIVIQPQSLFSILDHSLRSKDDQERVIGTLLGTRSEDGSEVEIKSAFAVPHFESESQVEIDIEYYKNMYSLHRRANPKEVLVGWYATSHELNPLSALIQSFFSSAPDGTYPFSAVHLTMQTNPAQDIDVRTYVSTAVGATPEPENTLFVPVPYELRYTEAERSGLELISSAKDQESRSASVVNDMQNLEKSVAELIDMIGRVQTYVEGVIAGSTPGSAAIGKFLLSNLSLTPRLDAEETEKLFNAHLQDVLLVVYLSNTVKTQMELFNALKRTAALSS